MTTPSSAEQILRALAAVCGPDFARAAGPGDTVAGRRARYVAAPATADGVADTLEVAADHGLVVVARGAGTKLDWGTPPDAVDLLLDTGRLAGVRDHHPDELTAAVGAGTPVRAVQQALAVHGQRLALDPPSPGATIGGVLAANESGPLRHRFGTPDEQVREYTLVDAACAVDRCPGGASDEADDDSDDGPPPGVLVSATVRLQPLPAARLWVNLPVSTPLQVHNFVADTLEAMVAPAAIEVDLPPADRPDLMSGEVSALLEGDPVGVRARAARLVGVFGDETTITTEPPSWWGRYPFGSPDVVLRLTVSIADLHAAVYALRDAAGRAVPIRGSAGIGTVHAVLPGATTPQRVEEIVESVRVVLLGRGGRCVVVSAPPAISALIDMATRPDFF